MHTARIVLALGITIVAACSSSSTTTNTTDAKDGGAGGSDAATAADGAAASGDDGGESSDAAETTDSGGGPTIDLGDGGCVTYDSASKLCGSMSDDSICKYSVTCGKSTSDGQCKINCEMAATVTCYSKADAQCLLDAVKSQSCTALKACKWIL